jgi:hypothetical protein
VNHAAQSIRFFSRCIERAAPLQPLSTGETDMKRTTLTLSTLFCAIAAVAAGSASAQSNTAAANAPLDKFLGSGTCTGKTLDKDMKSFHATTGKFSSRKILDGNWVEVRYDEDQSAAVAKPYHVIQHIGYDAAKKRYVGVTVDNSGSGYSTGSSKGWKGDSITFDESTDGQAAFFRDTFTSSGSGMSSHVGTMRDKSGKWIETDEEHCTSA